MNCPKEPGIGTSISHAFSLTELLVVLAIISIVAALAIPSIAPMIQTYNLNRSAALVGDEFAFARQSALTRNADVEVRFYQTGTPANPSDTQYRAIHSCLSANSQGLDKVSYFPTPIIISSSTQFSTLLDSSNPSRSGLYTGQEILPGGTTATPYVGFLFRATGSTGLTPITGTYGFWNVTLFAEYAPINAATGLPNNYVAVQVDPVTGQVVTYRPQ